MKHVYIAAFFISLLAFGGCKKDSAPQKTTPPVKQTNYHLEQALVNFTVNGQLQEAVIDTTENSVIIVVPDDANLHGLSATIQLASDITAKLNTTVVGTSSFNFDFSKPANLVVTSADGKQSLTFSVLVQTELQYWGLLGTVTAQKSLDKTYNFYYDQFDGSEWESINCGPTVSTMATKWADSTFTGTPAQARSLIRPEGGWWYTGDIQSYLALDQIRSRVDTLVNIDSLVKANIDNNRLIVLCLDMYYVRENDIQYQHTDKFYQASTTGWGHFLLVKGYKQLGNDFYLEIYDPYSEGRYYPGFDNQQIKGQNRYYLADDIQRSANIWWPYVITLGAKNAKTTNSRDMRTDGFGNPRKIREASGR